ncbi:hypothetical protein GCM10009539_32520 [Cryptosporangium japonicum]|uniref:Uncharacterized protein n=1 Tax=Cryptosporangium japonicum TaxID=80872 RepID=A0ABP3DX30_9ACTN
MEAAAAARNPESPKAGTDADPTVPGRTPFPVRTPGSGAGFAPVGGVAGAGSSDAGFAGETGFAEGAALGSGSSAVGVAAGDAAPGVFSECPTGAESDDASGGNGGRSSESIPRVVGSSSAGAPDAADGSASPRLAPPGVDEDDDADAELTSGAFSRLSGSGRAGMFGSVMRLRQVEVGGLGDSGYVGTHVRRGPRRPTR